MKWYVNYKYHRILALNSWNVNIASYTCISVQPGYYIMAANNYRWSQPVQHGTILCNYVKVITDDGKKPQAITFDCFGNICSLLKICQTSANFAFFFGKFARGCKPLWLSANMETRLCTSTEYLEGSSHWYSTWIANRSLRV